MPEQPDLHSTMYLFQRFGLFGNNGILTNLHSTMYLFQPASGGGQLWELCIYIPLCIYFNPKDSTEVAENITFTFHYVSISTISSDSATVAEIHLHSTMYLFQHNNSVTIQLLSAFTFHYVSISTTMRAAKQSIPFQFTFHYVSISTSLK